MKVQSNGHRAVNPDKNNDSTSDDHENKKGGAGRCSTGSDNAVGVALRLPVFVIGLSNKEKEEDFMAIKGSKLPQRPRKRAKQIQLTLNAVSPGAWLCNLSLDRYDVREKKISKKQRQRGLKAMGSIKDPDSEQQQ